MSFLAGLVIGATATWLFRHRRTYADGWRDGWEDKERALYGSELAAVVKAAREGR